jgi:class 3 adenylate cyclase
VTLPDAGAHLSESRGEDTLAAVHVVRFEPQAARPNGPPSKRLVFVGGAEPNGMYEFFDQLEIGRLDDGRAVTPGQLLVRAAHVSSRHCIITQHADGRCFVRDVSRNGTRLDGRRLMPNVEAELLVGQMLDLGSGLLLQLQGDVAPPVAVDAPRKRTSVQTQLTLATVLVGDIRDYTVMVREAPSAELQRCVSRVFQRLTAMVEAHGGTLKEFPGDAVLAFWEGGIDGAQAVAACHAAIALDALARQLATDNAIWTLRGFPLRMDWALASGGVVIDSFGGDTPVGLSMVGEPVVLACRLEKFANDEIGRILACPGTRQMVQQAQRASPGAPLEFLDRGVHQAKGFDRPDKIFALRLPEGP